MARKFLVSIDLNKNELQNAVIQNLGTAPASPTAGQIYYNTVDNQLYIYNGTRWEVAGNAVQSGLLASRPAANTVDVGTIYYATDTYLFYYSDGSTWTQTNAFGTVTAQTSYGASSGNGSSTNYARADHTHGTPALGTSTPNAISGAASSAGSATVPSKEDHTHAFTPSQNLSMATYKLTNLGTPTDSTDAATKAYADLKLSLTGGTLSGAIAMGTNKITGVGNPTDDQDAATKYYVDQAVQGLTWKVAANLLSTVNVALTGSTGTLNIDTYGALTSAESGYRIVLTNQTTDTEDGIYVYSDNGTAYTLTRSTDGNPYTELIGATIYIQEGTTKAGTSWSQSNHYLTSFAGQTWVQIAGVGIYTAGNGITITDNVISADAGSGITVDGTGINIDTTVVARKYSQAIGNGSDTSITVTHNLGTTDVVVSIYANSAPYAEVMCDVLHSTTNTVTLQFSVAPTSNQYRVAVIG
jgi:hypothetical protein